MNYADISAAFDRGTAADCLPHWALSLSRDIAAGRRDLLAVRHPLGFLCFPAERVGEYGVCLHLWTQPRPADVTTSQVHSHSWDLASLILYGRLRNQCVQVSEGPGTATHRIFEVRSHDDVDELHATSRLVSCEFGVACEYGQGHVYFLQAGQFHNTVVPDGDEGVATVVFGRTRASAADLSLGPPEVRSHTITRSRCGARETAEAACLIAEQLEAHGVA